MAYARYSFKAPERTLICALPVSDKQQSDKQQSCLLAVNLLLVAQTLSLLVDNTGLASLCTVGL